jgi:MFS family permease
MKELLQSRLAPFRHVNFRRFFFVQTMSLSGSWAADLARAWLVLSMMGTATALGGLMLASALPGLFLILHGGVLVDKVDVRKLMMWTKSLLGVIALGLAVLVEFSHVEYWQLLVFGCLEGLVTAFDSPTFQAVIVRLVPREEFQQALALNSTNFHVARMLGPAIAGALLAVHGPGAVFLFDAVTYFGVTAILAGMNFHHVRKAGSVLGGQWAAMLEGVRYIARNPAMRYRVLQLVMTIILPFPLMLVVFRTFMKVHFNLNADEFGFVMTLPALGSVAGALSFAVLKPKVPIRALMAGIPGVGLMVLAVPHMPAPILAGLMMACVGFFLYLTFASLTVSMQLDVDDAFRGRISSVIGLCFVSLGPLAGFPIGGLADRIGIVNSIQLVAAVFLSISAVLALLHRQAGFPPAGK